jgi:GNAT superfamily N-acetyltransferase
MTRQPNITLREFRPADLLPVRKLLLETIHVSFAGVYAPSAVRHFTRHHEPEEILTDAKGGFMILLESDGHIVATGTLTGEGKITRVYVRPDLQGRGLGKRIMARLEQHARDQGRQSVFLYSSLVAKRFYESLGYRLRAAKTATMDDDERLDYFEMDKSMIDAPASPGDGSSQMTTR